MTRPQRAIAPKPAKASRQADGVGLEIGKEDKKIYLLLSYYWKPLLMTFGDISLNGHMAVLCLGDEDLPKYLYVVNATRVEKGQFSLRADRNITLYLERVRDREYLLENQGQQAANVKMKEEPWEGVTAGIGCSRKDLRTNQHCYRGRRSKVYGRIRVSLQALIYIHQD